MSVFANRAVDHFVGRDVLRELFDDRSDRVLAAEAIVERLLRLFFGGFLHVVGNRGRRTEQRDSDDRSA
jgi:hypothetical protein